jgi:hypothetical protein
MSIDDGFKKMLAGIKQADEGRDEIMRGLEDAWEGRKDLDETIAELKTMMLQTAAEVRALRERLNGDE